MKQIVFKLLSFLFIASISGPVLSLKLSDIVNLRKRLNEKLPERERILTEGSGEMTSAVSEKETTLGRETAQKQEHKMKKTYQATLEKKKSGTIKRGLHPCPGDPGYSQEGVEQESNKKAKKALKTKAKVSKKARPSLIAQFKIIAAL